MVRMLCAICQHAIEATAVTHRCPECGAQYHDACWEYNGGCAEYGCGAAPAVAAHSVLEIPPAYWGKEHKNCPLCGEQILAGARRCRHCGTVFEASRPLDQEEFNRQSELRETVSGMRRVAIWLLILGAIPCTAPLVAIGGGLWCHSNREVLRRLTGFPAASWRLGLGLAYGQMLLLLIVLLFY